MVKPPSLNIYRMVHLYPFLTSIHFLHRDLSNPQKPSITPYSHYNPLQWKHFTNMHKSPLLGLSQSTFHTALFQTRWQYQPEFIYFGSKAISHIAITLYFRPDGIINHISYISGLEPYRISLSVGSKSIYKAHCYHLDLPMVMDPGI